MKLRLVVAGFNRAAAVAVPGRRAEFLQKTREHADESSVVGPHIFKSLENEIEQAFTENGLRAIALAVANWKTAEWHINDDLQFDKRLAEAREAAQ